MAQQQGQNLRNRKHGGGSAAAPSLKEEEPPPPVHDVADQKDNNNNNNNNADQEESASTASSSFRLTPLVERSLWRRLDVLPFFLAYTGLFVYDQNHTTTMTFSPSANNTSTNTAEFSTTATLLFGATLLAHLIVVVWTQWSVSGKARVGFFFSKDSTSSAMSPTSTSWTHCLVQSAHPELDGSTVAGIVPVARQQQPEGGAVVVTVTFQDRVFRYSATQPDLDITLWTTNNNDEDNLDAQSKTKSIGSIAFRPLQYPIQMPLSFYANDWKGHSSLASCQAAAQVYGRNSTALQLPSFTELLGVQLVAPFFLFQIFCVVLWSLDEYWYYALFTLLALLMFESTVAYNRLKGLERLHDISRKHQHRRIWVRRGMGPTSSDTNNCKWSWMSISVPELLPGDWVSLAGHHVPVPADILLLQGTAVCDEALLTGESVPQLKQPLDAAASSTATARSACLDLQSHKESILFGGTELVVGTAPSNDNNDSSNSPFNSSSSASSLTTVDDDTPPDRGVTGMVLRTGFETAQGNLLRTMAHSASKADGVHTVDTFVFILLLIACAVAAAAYVLKEGWHDERRNRFHLLLHVVIIITSVVPPELPMELSLAVTNSVQALIHRCQVYCTEHFRIPWAGEVTVCCFDKTGTLTSDEMRLKGVRLFESGQGDKRSTTKESESADEDTALVHPDQSELPRTTVRIMAACHSLAIAATGDGRRIQVIGDPLEQAVMKHTGYSLRGNNIVAPTMETAQADTNCRPIIILHRFSFSSKLKRMTVLVSEEAGATGTVWALVKGAPETIKAFLSPDSVPPDYDEVSFHHMSRGRRVLAMAYREVGNVRNLKTFKDGGRGLIERSLTFAGFLVLDCPLKSDSKSVISELKKSGHNVVMITGDAILTAAEVARQVGIIRRSSSSKKRLVYRIQERGEGSVSKSGNIEDPFSHFECKPFGRNVDDNKATLPLSRPMIADLLQSFKQGEASFCISGDALVSLAHRAVKMESLSRMPSRSSTLDETNLLLSPASQKALKQLVPLVSVFARHAPHQKEAVVAAYNHGGFQTLMCGDGTNDVGALKRAHVGISIISAPNVESKQSEANERISEAKAEQKEKQLGKSKKKKSKKSRATNLEESLRQLQEAQAELDQVELGDASVAAPFTSRAVSIKCCKDVIQQGRCTLVTMLQIYKILGINCLVNALVLSKLFLHGVKQGDRQLTILGIVVAALFYFVTRAEPLSTLSPIRPPASVLCIQALVSISGQFLLHLATILIATEAALSFVDPFDPSLVPDGPFNPNVLNSCAFLLTCLSTINTFAVNYRGRPFMKDLHENRLFYRSLQVCYGALAICSLEIFPPLNDLLQLTTLPSVSEITVDTSNPLHNLIVAVDFPVFMVTLMAINTVLAFSFERMVLRFFEERKN